MKAKTILK